MQNWETIFLKYYEHMLEDELINFKPIVDNKYYLI